MLDIVRVENEKTKTKLGYNAKKFKYYMLIKNDLFLFCKTVRNLKKKYRFYS
jgi:hypothetical protein